MGHAFKAPAADFKNCHSINRFFQILRFTWEEHPGAPPVLGDELPHESPPHVLLPSHQLDSGPDQPGVLRPPPQDEAAEGGAGEEEVAAAAGGGERGRGDERPGLRVIEGDNF